MQVPSHTLDPYRRAWALSWPVMLANLSVPLSGAVDTAVVGHLPEVAYIGAVGIGALIFGFIYWAFSVLRMGTTGFVAQSFGAGNEADVFDAASRSLVLAALCAFVLLLGQFPLAQLFYYFIQGEADVEAYSRAYFDVRIWGAPGALANFVVLGVLFGLQRMRAALVTQLVLNGLNIVLDFWFVLGLGWAVQGVALATVLSEYAAAILGVVLVRAHLPGFATRFYWRRLADMTAVRTMVSVSRDLMIRTMLVNGVFLHFTSESAEFGKVVLAVNTILGHLFHALAFGLDGFAHAVEALGGHAYGRKDRRAFDIAVKSCVLLSVVVASGFCLVYWMGGGVFVRLMTDAPAVLAAAEIYLPWMVVMPLLAVWSYLLDGVFIGTTRAAEMRDAMIASTFAYVIAFWVLPSDLANHGLWLAIAIFTVARAVTLTLWYRRVLAHFH